jgi:hypothetical protein
VLEASPDSTAAPAQSTAPPAPPAETPKPGLRLPSIFGKKPPAARPDTAAVR